MAGSRTAFIAPAGYGKTHAIVDRVGSSPAKTLVLTHTNAGVTAINCRLREVGIGRSSFNLSTIAAYCELWARAYPEISGFDALVGLASSERYERIYPDAKRVFSEKWAQRVIGASYSYVIVDEYQDCTVDQRDALFSLAAEMDLVVYGDPMQGVFYWAGRICVTRPSTSGCSTRGRTDGLTQTPKSWEVKSRASARSFCRRFAARVCL